MSLQSFLDYLTYEKHSSVHTVAAYKNDIKSFFEFANIEFGVTEEAEINYSMIRSWIVELVQEELANRSINRKISSLKAYYKFLQKIEAIEISPLAKHKALKVKKKIQIPFSEEEVEDVFKMVGSDQDFETLRNRVMVELFYGTGIRRSELINLKISDINFGNNTIKVLGKRNKERILPLLKFLEESIKEYLIVRQKFLSNNTDPHLLLTNKGVKMYETFVYRIINGYFSQASKKVKTSPHMLRHTFATHLLNEGADLNAVKDLLGHTSLAATQVYTHNSIAELSKAHNKFHPRNKKQ